MLMKLNLNNNSINLVNCIADDRSDIQVCCFFNNVTFFFFAIYKKQKNK